MKKNTLLIVCLFLVNSLVYSQTLDQAQLEVKYNYEVANNRLKPDKKTQDETILLIGSNYTNYYSFKNYIFDSIKKVNPSYYESQTTFHSPTHATIIINAPPVNGFNDAHYFIDKRTGEVLCLDKVTSLQGCFYYSYKEMIEKPVWEISPETGIVAGYRCQKATTRYGKRNWTAWFTPEIPVSEGPWKLRGLPGLILKAETDDGEFALSATSVSRSSGRAIVKDETNKYRNVSKKELIKLQIDGVRNTVALLGTVAFEYNPIEMVD